MRFDAIGMWWEDLPTTRERNKLDRPMPKIPESGWKPPASFPDLGNAVLIALDLETYDPDLLTHGPGWARNVGHIVGVSIAALDSLGNHTVWYFPFRHETETNLNMERENVLAWLSVALSNEMTAKVGANLLYDIGWLRHEGIEVRGPLYDVQYAEALLEESANVALETLGQKYLNEGKESNALYDWLALWFGGDPGPGQRKYIYKAPPSLVGPYAESDADLPLRLLQVMYPLLVKEGLWELFDMECRLIRLVMEMRFEGVTVDIEKAEQLNEQLKQRIEAGHERLTKAIGFEVNINSAQDLAKAFDEIGLKYPITEKGNPSFAKGVLEGISHPVPELILDIRKLDKLRGTFIESYILNSHINGKVYGSFHQLRNEGGGTRSGRFSSSNPNLQNIPSRDDELAPLIRGMFIPDPGHLQWRKYDYSQIEYRLLLHYAVGPAGDEIRSYFNKHPDTDYHVYAQQLVQEKAGVFIDRKPIKNINFGLIYGMGASTLGADLNMSKKDAENLMAAYFKGVPFAKPTMEMAEAEAASLGYITTILGRKSRFDLWEPLRFGEGHPMPRDKALAVYGNAIKRAGTRKALNRRLQGSAADLMKMAMLICYEDGIFNETGIPRLTVHDELDFSDPGGTDKAFIEMKRVMETAIDLKIPIKADGEVGPNWGNVKAI